MKLQILQETTKWNHESIGYQVPNHTYLVCENRFLAYIKSGTTLPIYFKKAMIFDKRGRTFREIKGNLFDLTLIPEMPAV